MPDFTPKLHSLSINDSEIDFHLRHIIIGGIRYFSLVDLIAKYTDGEPRKHWWDIKMSLQYWDIRIDILRMKLPAADGKLYLTDVGTIETCNQVVEFLNSKFRKHSVYKLEIQDLHPLVAHKLNTDGYATIQHFRLKSGKKVDFIAHSHAHTLIVECKLTLLNSIFFQAIGQVMCYQTEYGHNAVPVLATFADCIDDYACQSAARLGVQIITVQKPKIQQ